MPTRMWAEDANGVVREVLCDTNGNLLTAQAIVSPIAGFEQLGVPSSSAVTLTVPTSATMAIVYVEAANVRWRDDGTSPTTSVGMLAKNDSTITFDSLGNLSAIEFVATGSSALLDVSYYG